MHGDDIFNAGPRQQVLKMAALGERRRGVLRFRAGSVNCVQRSQLASARSIQSELGDLGSRCAVDVRCFPLPGRHRSLAAPWSQHRVETCGLDGSVVARCHLGHEVDIVKSTRQGKCPRRVHHSKERLRAKRRFVCVFTCHSEDAIVADPAYWSSLSQKKERSSGMGRGYTRLSLSCAGSLTS